MKIHLDFKELTFLLAEALVKKNMGEGSFDVRSFFIHEQVGSECCITGVDVEITKLEKK